MKEHYSHTQTAETESPSDALPISEAGSQKQVGTLLRQLRARQKMSGEELSKHLDVSRGAVGHWELGRRALPRDLPFVRTLLNTLNPSDAERKVLLKLILGTEVLTEEAQSDEAFYEEMRRRTDRMMRLGAHVVALQAELDRELTVVRSALHDRFLRPDQRGTPEETDFGRGSKEDVSLTPKRPADK